MAVKLLYNMDHMRAVLKGRSSSPEKSDMGEKTTIPPLMTSFIDGSFDDICLNDVSWRLSTRYLANASPESVGLETSRLKFWTRPRLRKMSRSRSVRSPARTISSSRRERRCWKWSKLERFSSQQIVYMISEHTSFSKNNWQQTGGLFLNNLSTALTLKAAGWRFSIFSPSRTIFLSLKGNMSWSSCLKTPPPSPKPGLELEPDVLGVPAGAWE